MDKTFDPSETESHWYEEWEKQASRMLGLKLVSSKNVGLNAGVGPELVRRPMLQRWNLDMQAFEDMQ